MTSPILEARTITRHYQRGPQTVKAVDGVSLAVAPGEFVALVGASGSGKSTLLNLLAGLDTPTSGEVYAAGMRLSDLSARQLADYRANRIGMVFQTFNLVPHRSALANVELALYFNGTPRADRHDQAARLLTELGLGDRLDHVPADLSGGEQQRVALARALVKEPSILFADEPTGNLDHDNSERIAELLVTLNRDGLTIVLVTHDRHLAARRATRTVRLHYGRIADGDSGWAGEVAP
ncbi:ATP-binding cassette domain-containing protein [candidate division GN15 bacterium]|nr:ATP-binding cassette domain-containing protein [candidate division GN15 bacterium]